MKGTNRKIENVAGKQKNGKEAGENNEAMREIVENIIPKRADERLQ